MAVRRPLGRGRCGSLGLALADVDPAAEEAGHTGFVSAYDRLRLHKLAAEELAACDAGDLREALRLSELYEQAEKKAFGL